MKTMKILFLVLFTFSASVSYAQLVVDGNGKVKMAGSLPYPYHEYDVAQFCGNVSIFGELYTDIATGIISNSGGSRLSEITAPTISACRQLYALSGNGENSDDVSGISFEQLQALFPSLARVSQDGHKSVNYIGLIPVLVQAVNELQGEVRSLQRQLETLRSK